MRRMYDKSLEIGMSMGGNVMAGEGKHRNYGKGSSSWESKERRKKLGKGEGWSEGRENMGRGSLKDIIKVLLGVIGYETDQFFFFIFYIFFIPSDFPGPIRTQSAELPAKPCWRRIGFLRFCWPFLLYRLLGIRWSSKIYPSLVTTVWTSTGYPLFLIRGGWKHFINYFSRKYRVKYNTIINNSFIFFSIIEKSEFQGFPYCRFRYRHLTTHGISDGSLLC